MPHKNHLHTPCSRITVSQRIIQSSRRQAEQTAHQSRGTQTFKIVFYGSHAQDFAPVEDPRLVFVDAARMAPYSRDLQPRQPVLIDRDTIPSFREYQSSTNDVNKDS